jgi:hypothetical protein
MTIGVRDRAAGMDSDPCVGQSSDLRPPNFVESKQYAQDLLDDVLKKRNGQSE